jgi:signal transduction histidine kinase
MSKWTPFITTKKRKESCMKRFAMLLALVTLLLSITSPVFAGSFGTAEEAKAMLEKAVAAIKANKAEALAQFAKGEGGFKDRDLYPFCGGADGNFTAHPSLVGKSLKGLKDKAGKALGEEIYATAKEGAIGEVAYMWPRPGSTDPVQKISYVTKVDDQVCAVGYYK